MSVTVPTRWLLGAVGRCRAWRPFSLLCGTFIHEVMADADELRLRRARALRSRALTFLRCCASPPSRERPTFLYLFYSRARCNSGSIRDLLASCRIDSLLFFLPAEPYTRDGNKAAHSHRSALRTLTVPSLAMHKQACKRKHINAGAASKFSSLSPQFKLPGL